jgi:hypothetical protein
MSDVESIERFWILSAASNGQELTQEAWLQQIESDPRLTTRASRRVPNPFKPGEEMIVQPNPLNAIVAIDSETLGHLSWAEDDTNEIVATCRTQKNHDSMRRLVHEIAERLCCKVEEGSE